MLISDKLSNKINLMTEALEYVNKIEEKKCFENNNKLMETKFNKIKKESNLNYYFECYELSDFENKMKIDMFYINKLLSNLEENQINALSPLLREHYKNICRIYEHVNIQPNIYGKNVNVNILSESENKIEDTIKNVLNEYFNKNFYSLDVNSREKKFLDVIREDVKVCIKKGMSPDDAMIYCTKMNLVETLLTNIAFPYREYCKINELTIDEDYGKIFDQETLVEHFENFKKTTKNLSKVIAAAI